MMRRDLMRPQCIGQGDVQIGPDEREIIVAAIPQDDVGFLLCRAEDVGVIDAGEDEIAECDVRLVFLALLDRALRRVEIGLAATA